MPRAAALLVVVAALAATLGACSDDGRDLREPLAEQTTTTAVPAEDDEATAEPGAEAGVDGFTVRVEQLLPSDPIPTELTCDGDDLPPTLVWQNVPAETGELAISMTDPDADGFVHWLVVGIDAGVAGVDGSDLPPGSQVLANSTGDAVWTGPCPPPDDGAHDYVFTLYALGDAAAVRTGEEPTTVLSDLAGTSLATTTVVGTYARS